MTITINGNGTVTGISAGGLPDNIITNAEMADDSVGIADLSATGTAGATTFLRGDNSWAVPAGKIFDIKVDEYGGGNTTITTNDWTDTGHSITIGGSGGTKILLFLAAQISNSYSTNIIPAYGIKMNDNSNTSGAFVWRQNQYDAGGQNMVNLIDWHTTSTSQTFKVRGYQSGGTNTQYLTGATLVAVEV